MCGIVGIFNRGAGAAPAPRTIADMVAMVQHRGPEASGLYVDDDVGLGHARLSIVDPASGRQPLTNEDESLWLVANGEIFNYVELRAEIEARGHHFRTGSDCEIILHLYEERGLDCVHALNGDFAFALWDRDRQHLVLGRDRVGVRPLFYTEGRGTLLFGSEIKALLAHPAISRTPDLVALGQVFTGWSPLPPRTMFKGIHSLRPGHLLVATAHHTAVRPYWHLRFPEEGAPAPMSRDSAAAQLHSLLLDATRIRLRADVPVGAYVSGGLDSSAVTALARQHTTNRLQTFAVAFHDGEYDERPYQERVARLLGTDHHTVDCRPEDIGRVFPEVIWHAETPLLRTAPAPMFLLSGLVRAHGFKVVLSGEGADEFLLGYDIFKETKVRTFWARRRESRLRPRLLRRLYGHIPELSRPSQAYLEAFFGSGLDQVEAYGFSHLLRWTNTARLHRYFGPAVQAAVAEAGAADLDALLAGQGSDWDTVSRAQYNEITSFLDPYLLAAQGDRVAMAHAVEGRFPFLDHRLIEFCNSLPPQMKMAGLNEKVLLKRAAADLLPPGILERPKQPFRAPIRSAFAGPNAPDYVRELLDPARVAADGVFKPDAVAWLVNRANGDGRLGELDNMALVGVISVGLFKRAFWDEFDGHAHTSRASAQEIATVIDSRGHRAKRVAAALRGHPAAVHA